MPDGIFSLFGVIADTVGNTLLASEKLHTQISPRIFFYLGVASLTPCYGETAYAAFSLHTENLDVAGLGHLRVSIMNPSARRPIHVEIVRC